MRNNDVFILELDRPRELNFRHKEMKRLQALFHIAPEALDDPTDAETVEKIVFVMLERDALAHGETLKPKDMEDLLDHAPHYGSIIDAMMRCITAAFAPDDDPEAAAAEDSGNNPTHPAV